MSLDTYTVLTIVSLSL